MGRPNARNNFQNIGLGLERPRFLPIDGGKVFQYRDYMDPELSALEERLAVLVQRLKALREENRDLRQQLAMRTDENARNVEKLAAARTRIEALLKQIPETES
jgi:uncharacterized protein (TIGR02449 family)